MMKPWSIVRILGTLACSVVLIASAAAEGRKLSGDEIRSVVSGATVYATSVKGYAIMEKMNTDGSTSATAGVSWSDTGVWSIEGDTWCLQWKKIRKGKKGCFELFQIDDENFRLIGPIGAREDTRHRPEIKIYR